ncbi:hypothetical protein D3C72_1005990 [compost metagenome]
MHQAVTYGLLCFLTDRTGIDQHQVGIFYDFCCSKPMFVQDRSNDFTIIKIHGTSITFDIEMLLKLLFSFQLSPISLALASLIHCLIMRF